MRAIDRYRKEHADDSRSDECIIRQCCVDSYDYNIETKKDGECCNSCKECWESKIVDNPLNEEDHDKVWAECICPVAFLSAENGEINFFNGKYYKAVLSLDSVELYYTPILQKSVKIDINTFKAFFRVVSKYMEVEKRVFRCQFKAVLKYTDRRCITFKESMICKAEIRGKETIVYPYVDSIKEYYPLPTDYFLEHFKLTGGKRDLNESNR